MEVAEGGELIRFAREADAGALADIYRPGVEGIASFELAAPTADTMRDRVCAVMPARPWLVYEADDDVAGFAYAGEHRARIAYRWSVDVSLYVRPASQGCGIGQGLYESLLALLTEQGYVNAYAGITLPNAASLGLHKKLGFVDVGVYKHVGYKAGAWHDVAWLARGLSEVTTNPVEPRSLDELDTAVIEAALRIGLESIRMRSQGPHG